VLVWMSRHTGTILAPIKAIFMMRPILFDLDGTLIDHFTTIAKSVAYAQRQLGLPESDYATVRSTVGGSVPVTLGKLCGESNVAAAEPLFREHFDSILFDDVFALPGAAWLLQNLHERGHRLAVFTNKYIDHSRATLEHLGLSKWLHCIIGTGDPACPFRKPDPRFTVYALEQLDCSSEEALMIGDSPYDLAAAEAGGVACLLVASGSHDAHELSAHLTSDRIFSDLHELGRHYFGLDPAVDQT
jgi:phosphoglycolate phosphatase